MAARMPCDRSCRCIGRGSVGRESGLTEGSSGGAARLGSREISSEDA